MQRTVYLTRNGTLLTLTPAASCGEYVTFDTDEVITSSSVKEISPFVYMVRINDEREVHLAVFRLDGRSKPRIVKLHDVLDSDSRETLAVRMFTRLLSFDNNRLGNRDRNMLVPILRQSCPEFFQGHIDNDNGRFHYTVYKSLLTIFNDRKVGIHRSNFVKLSRSIKDSLK